MCSTEGSVGKVCVLMRVPLERYVFYVLVRVPLARCVFCVLLRVPLARCVCSSDSERRLSAGFARNVTFKTSSFLDADKLSKHCHVDAISL